MARLARLARLTRLAFRATCPIVGRLHQRGQLSSLTSGKVEFAMSKMAGTRSGSQRTHHRALDKSPHGNQ